MVSGCISSYPRRYLGYQVRKLFEETGEKITKTLVSIIDEFLTKYEADIPTRFDSPELIGQIYSEVRETYLMRSKSQSIR